MYKNFTIADIMAFSLYVPYFGIPHDLKILCNIFLNCELQNRLNMKGVSLYIWWQLIRRETMATSWYDHLTTFQGKKIFKMLMIGIREAVEWIYNGIKQIWMRNGLGR